MNLAVLNCMCGIQAPTAFDPANFNTIKAMQCALALEVSVNKSLLAMHDEAEGDPEVKYLSIILLLFFF